MRQPKLNWKDIYPELVNKMRWAISTSLKTQGSNYPFSTSQLIATVCAQDVIDLCKVAEEAPGVIGSTSLIRDFLAQARVDVT